MLAGAAVAGSAGAGDSAWAANEADPSSHGSSNDGVTFPAPISLDEALKTESSPQRANTGRANATASRDAGVATRNAFRAKLRERSW